jgi:hypothetical protein
VAVDFVAMVSKPFTLARLLEAAADAAAELLAGARPPWPEVLLDRQHGQGQQLFSSGRQANEEELSQIVLGPRPDDPRSPREIDLVDGDRDRDLASVFEVRSPGEWRLIFSPRRDAAGVVYALSLAIAAAREGSGRVHDHDLRLTDPDLDDPDEIVATTRLSEPSGSYQEAARAYLGQFPQLQGWPPS